MEKKTKAATQTGVYLLIIAAILVVVNVISSRSYVRIDVTRNERFSLSKGSARLVRDGLNKDMQIDVYVTRGLPKFEVFIQDLTDLMNEYERASNGKLHYALIEPKTDEQRTAAKEAGLHEAAFGEGNKKGGKDQALISKGFMGMSFKYGSEKDAIPIMSPEQAMGLEFWITNKIREIRDRADEKHQKLGVISGKDEIKLSDANLVAAQGGRGGPTMKGILDQALPFYKVEDVDLQGGEAEINKELVGLIVTQPGKEFTEKELRRIDQFLMLGNKAIVFFAGAVNVKASDATMKAELNTRGLEKLLDGYGIEMKKEAIFDKNRAAALRIQTQGQSFVWAGHPAIMVATADNRMEEKEQFLDPTFPGFFRMEEIVFPFPSTLVAHPEKQPEAAMKVVARSTRGSWVIGTDTVDMKIADFKPQGELGQRAMAITVEGKLKSAFGGKDEGGFSAPPVSKDKSRVLVISASQFLANPFARAGNAPPMPPQMQMMGQMGGDEELMMISGPYAQQYLTTTILTFKNILDWLGGDTDLIAVSAKLIGEPNLTYSDVNKQRQPASNDPDAKKANEEYDAELDRVQAGVQWTMTLGPAVLFALFGVFRWRRRESSRANITIN